MRKLHELLASDEPEAEGLLSYDCSYGIRLANRELFTLVNEVSQRNQKIIKTLSLTLNGKTKIFPLVKKRTATLEISSISMITSAQHTKVLKLSQEKFDKLQDEHEDFVPSEVVLEAFYTTNNEYAEDRDSYFRISKDRISIFDSDDQLKMTFRGFKF